MAIRLRSIANDLLGFYFPPSIVKTVKLGFVKQRFLNLNLGKSGSHRGRAIQARLLASRPIPDRPALRRSSPAKGRGGGKCYNAHFLWPEGRE